MLKLILRKARHKHVHFWQQVARAVLYRYVPTVLITLMAPQSCCARQGRHCAACLCDGLVCNFAATKFWASFFSPFSALARPPPPLLLYVRCISEKERGGKRGEMGEGGGKAYLAKKKKKKKKKEQSVSSRTVRSKAVHGRTCFLFRGGEGHRKIRRRYMSKRGRETVKRGAALRREGACRKLQWQEGRKEREGSVKGPSSLLFFPLILWPKSPPFFECSSLEGLPRCI